MGKIVRDERYTNTIWCLCNNYNEYLQFAKDLYLYKGDESVRLYEYYDEDVRWIKDTWEWMRLFDVDSVPVEDNDSDEEYLPVDPINDVYEIKEKPDDAEYPIIIYYSMYEKELLWISLKKLNTANLGAAYG